jgi:hypothetical protein
MLRERLTGFFEQFAPTPWAWLALGVGIFVHFVGFFLFRIEMPGLFSGDLPEARFTFVELQASNVSEDLRDQAWLSDSRPLFLPSEVNAGWEQYQPGYYLDTQQQSVLRPVEREVVLDAASILDPFPAGPASWDPRQMLHVDVWPVLRTLGEGETTPTLLPERFAVLAFIDEATRQPCCEFPYASPPAGMEVNTPLWRPVVVFIQVAVDGAVGFPFLRETSGVSALDQFAMREAFRIANLRLVPPGYYRVVLGL